MHASDSNRSPVRLSVFTALSFAVFAALIENAGVGCSEAELADPSVSSADAGNARRDGAPVGPVFAPPAGDGGPRGVGPSCDRYCELVTENCKDEYAQYASQDECLAFCNHLPLSTPMPPTEDKAGASVACRQYWADSPARTSPKDYCLRAGPFGGNVCGDRCTTFCSVVLAACAPGSSVSVYATQPECATACAAFAYVDAGAEGGGEGPDGPKSGNSLNCRLFHLREAAGKPAACATLAFDGGACTGEE